MITGYVCVCVCACVRVRVWGGINPVIFTVGNPRKEFAEQGI